MRQLLLPGTASLKGPSGSCVSCRQRARGGRDRQRAAQGSPVPRTIPQLYLWHTRLILDPDPITFSLMKAQMIRVISSPSISTTGFATLIRLSASAEQRGRVLGVHPWSHSSTPLCGARVSCGDHTAPSSQVGVPPLLRVRDRSGKSPAEVWASYWGQRCWSGVSAKPTV